MKTANQIVTVAERIVETLDNSLDMIATHTDPRSEDIRQKLFDVRNRTSNEIEHVRRYGLDDKAGQRAADLLAFVKTVYEDVRAYMSGPISLH